MEPRPPFATSNTSKPSRLATSALLKPITLPTPARTGHTRLTRLTRLGGKCERVAPMTSYSGSAARLKHPPRDGKLCLGSDLLHQRDLSPIGRSPLPQVFHHQEADVRYRPHLAGLTKGTQAWCVTHPYVRCLQPPRNRCSASIPGIHPGSASPVAHGRSVSSVATEGQRRGIVPCVFPHRDPMLCVCGYSLALVSCDGPSPNATMHNVFLPSGECRADSPCHQGTASCTPCE